ncbi:hypothetical protein C8A05DRAFT_48229 [Staphylotrichum tortipilum]|uniref:Cytoplasmic tRNA 2-thiolation protein 2 n=1 Tax=Staphylotrichum tortipilum TaxID=2831512 RepID=A0AAN6RP27_9PEZI|nr:hypothetical protein C8A05DRAFT_48229 [Staphylotrichum longicolle]
MASAETDPPARPLTRPCVKCRTQEATLDSRSQPVCKDCFTKFIATKCIKQIGILGRETRPAPPPTGGPPTGTRRYLLGLSLGVSSTVLLHLLNENVEFQLAKGRNAPFELVVIHVDTTTHGGEAVGPSPGLGGAATPATAEAALARLRARYPRFTFQLVPLPTLTPNPQTTLTTIPDHTTTANHPPPPPSLGVLPQDLTAASLSDIRTHLTRRTLLSLAAQQNCQALLLGHSTTALAELTLAEAAKGRGVAVPWLVGDGPLPAAGDGEGRGDGVSGDGGGGGKGAPPILPPHLPPPPLTSPPLTPLILDPLSPGTTPAAVVSHKDLSIEQVMTRYFAEVEENYPSVVANVARTTAKLMRVASEDGEGCALCGMPLDEDGDERWRGELGIQSGEDGVSAAGMGFGGRLCYGCERSTGG